MNRIKTYASAAALFAACAANAAVLDVQIDFDIVDANAFASEVGLPQSAGFQGYTGDILNGFSDQNADAAHHTWTVGGTLDTVTGVVKVAGVNGWKYNTQNVQTGIDDLVNLGASFTSNGGLLIPGSSFVNVTSWNVVGGKSYCTDLAGVVCAYLGVTSAGTTPSPLTPTGTLVFNGGAGFVTGSSASITAVNNANGVNSTETMTVTILAAPILPPAPPAGPSPGVPVPIPFIASLLGALGVGLAGLFRIRRRK